MTPLDADSEALLRDVLPAYAPSPDMPPEAARKLAHDLATRLQGDPPPMEAVETMTVESASATIPIRFCRPSGADGGWLLWIHGGGFMTGGLDTHDALCRRLAHGCGQAVISVDYRLAPEFNYPAALDDCVAVFRWLMENGGELGLDRDRAAIGGSSAGGNLAAALAIANRRGDDLPIRRQILVYPAVDATLGSASKSPHGEGYQLTLAMMKRYLDAYCGPLPDRTVETLSPLFSPDLSGLPPALVVIAELDPLAEEGLAYARRLQEAGVAATTRVYEGVMHGFFGQAGAIAKARQAQDIVCAELAEALRA